MMMKRHVGKMANTDQRVVVVYMQIPNRPDHALVVSTDNLPPRLEQALTDVVNSNEAQAETVLANVLGHHLDPDSSRPLLNVLHDRGLLQPVLIDHVLMMPMPNMPFKLRDIIDKMGNSELPPVVNATQADQKFNPHTHNNSAQSKEERIGIAKNLLIQADIMKQDAEAKLEEAYRMAPELRTETTTKVSTAKIETAKSKKTRASVTATKIAPKPKKTADKVAKANV